MGRRKRPDYGPLCRVTENRQLDSVRQTGAALLFGMATGRRMTRRDRFPCGWRPEPADQDRLVEDAENRRPGRDFGRSPEGSRPAAAE
jgi:hypothetical protein